MGQIVVLNLRERHFSEKSLNASRVKHCLESYLNKLSQLLIDMSHVRKISNLTNPIHSNYSSTHWCTFRLCKNIYT